MRKHGVSLRRAEDFEESTAMFDVDDSQDYGEVRFNAVGWLHGRLHTLTFSPRGNAVRAISLRGATKEEERRYAKQFGKA